MPRRADPLRVQIKLLEAHIKADKAEHRAAERPLRASRRALTERLRKLRFYLAKAQERRAAMLAQFWITSERDAELCYRERWRAVADSIARYTADIAGTELDLALFTELHTELPA